GRILLELEDRRMEGQAVLDLCLNHRRTAIALLLSALDDQGFRQNLYQSGRAYAFLLRMAQQGYEADPYFTCKSRAEPFWDAIAADDVESAREIASLTPIQWQQGLEDESDYRYVDFIQALLRSPNEMSLLEARLDAFARSLEGGDSARLGLCTALLQRDEQRFGSALLELLDEHHHFYSELIHADSIAHEDAQTQAFVFIEGIALVKLARLLELHPRRQLRFIPDVTLALPSSPLDRSDPWVELAAS
ncbi:Imm49 family immunity protein, partial [Archangium sp.]|uniref:Imm49 family immunity protein n=1 Tax=Archangium sp. TaxID=1872627 RepID=UPI002D56AA0C